MAIKDGIMSWFIRNIVIPRTEIIDCPGFIVLKLSEKGKKTYLRELFFPEGLLADLEKKVVSEAGDKGGQALYSAGKKFGFRFASTSNYPVVSKSSQRELKNFLYMFLRYMESTYAHRLDCKVDFRQRKYTMTMDKYIVCNKNGIGLILTGGGSAGVWAYMQEDPTIEGVQTKCQGRGADKCQVVCTPLKNLRSTYNGKIFAEKDMSNLGLSGEYAHINEIRPTSYAKESLKNLLDSGFFKSKEGVIIRNSERYFLCESSLFYLSERELEKVGLSDLTFQVSFDFGKRIAKNESSTNYANFITDYLSALGWGDVILLRDDSSYKVLSAYFPWCRFSESSNYLIYRGLLSGMVSGFTKKDVFFKHHKLNKDGSKITLTISNNELH